MMGRYFVAREGGALIHVYDIDDTYAQCAFIGSPAYDSMKAAGPGGTPSARGKFAMPIAQYDSTFVRDYRPARTADLGGADQPIRLPANATAEWAREGEDDTTRLLRELRDELERLNLSDLVARIDAVLALGAALPAPVA
jgi:hypothetical protein